ERTAFRITAPRKTRRTASQIDRGPRRPDAVPGAFLDPLSTAARPTHPSAVACEGGPLMARRRTATAGTAASVPPRRRADNRPQVPFPYKLVLHQWLLSLFNVQRFEDLAQHLRNEELEGLDENNIHRFHHALTAQLFNLTELPTELP